MRDVHEGVKTVDRRGSEDPRVTIVVPTYNRAGWLAGAIESALGQTYPDLRVVVSDNASTDETPTVVAGFDDPRLSYVRLDRKLELNEHFNRCIDRAETEYLFLLPDDDRMLPELLEVAVPLLDAHPRVGLVHGRVRNVDDDDRVIADDHDMTGLRELTIEAGHDFVRRSLCESYRVHASTALIRTAALDGLRLDPADYPATDFGLWLRLALDWDVAFVPQTLAVYRLHPTSYTAGGAGLTSGGYVQGTTLITAVRDVKERLLVEQGERLGEVDLLRADARRSYRRALVNQAGHLTLPRRRLGETVRVLADCVRRDPRTALEPGAWRLLAGALLGRRAAERLKRRRVARARKLRMARG